MRTDSPMPTTQAPTRGYTATKDQLLARLQADRGSGPRDRGDGAGRSLLHRHPHPDISAVQAALDKVALGLLDGHAHTCVIGAEPDQRDERTEEMMAAVGRLLRRG